MKLLPNTKYTTRDGTEVLITDVNTENGTSYKITGNIVDSSVKMSWLDNGSYLAPTVKHSFDITQGENP